MNEGRPQRRGIGLSAGIKMAVGATEVVAYVAAGVLASSHENLLTQADDLAIVPVRHRALGRGGKRRADSCRLCICTGT